jgi:hypothetical protein
MKYWLSLYYTQALEELPGCAEWGQSTFLAFRSRLLSCSLVTETQQSHLNKRKRIRFVPPLLSLPLPIGFRARQRLPLLGHLFAEPTYKQVSHERTQADARWA